MSPSSSGNDLVSRSSEGQDRQDAHAQEQPKSVPAENPSSALAPQNIALFGPPGSGKSSVGFALAQCLERSFVDMDEQIETRAGKSIDRIFAEDGETTFRKMEASFCRELAAQTGLVIACGGGALINNQNREILQASSAVVFLDCDEAELLRRMDGSSDRPLLAGDTTARLKNLLKSREHVYQSFPRRVDTTHLNQDQIAAQIAEMVPKNETAALSVRHPPPGYPVIIGSHLLEGLSSMLSERGLQSPFVVISDTNVGPLYTDQIEPSLDADGVVLPAGEAHKTLDTVHGIYERFLDFGLERKGTVIALGGGVIGDITGFAASTFMRGVRWVNLPTSLLAMVDASVGGKVGVDLPRGKNLVGAFHQPELVLIDVVTLNTLPPVEFRNGMAELVKSALIGDPQLFNWLENHHGLPTQRWLERALSVKIGIIETDPFEGGERAKLNLGHTVAHGLETASNYRIRHGEAVAVGMVAETRMGEAIGLTEVGLSERVETVLTRLHLPIRYSDLSTKEVRSAMTSDKKRDRGRLLFSLPIAPGNVEFRHPVPEDVLIQVLEDMQEAP